MMIKNSQGETILTWQMLMIISLTSFAIFLGGVSSGYFYFRAEYLPKAEARDKVVEEIKKQVDQLPTQKELKQVVREESK